MWIKIEITGLLIGLVAIAFELITIFSWFSFSDGFHELFYGGAPGAMLVVIALIIGMLSSILYLINVMCRRRRLWWLRLLSFLTMYLGFAVIGASGI